MQRRPSRRSSSAVIAALATGLFLVGSARAGQFTGIVSFGDSLSDVGNYYAETGGALPPSQYGYDAGRYSNGPLWVEYLARDLGLPTPTPSSSGGTDYAYGSAATGPGTTEYTFPGTSVTLPVPNIDTQIASYLASHTPTAGQIFTIWGGANDLFYGQTNPLIPAQNIANEIGTLAGAGAKVVLIPNLPPMGDLPYSLAMPASVRSDLNAFAVGFNTILQSEAAQLDQKLGVQVHIVDVYSLMNDAIANPSKYGFTDVTDAALSSNSNGAGYLFWDGGHPTTQADTFIASLAAQSVPEPSSLVMLGTALVVVVGVAARLRRKTAFPAAL